MIRCPHCGSQYEAPHRGEFYVCPHCGGVVRRGEPYLDVYIFKNAVDKSAAFSKALHLAPTGSPEDLHVSSLVDAQLHFLPLYLYRVEFIPLRLSAYHAALALRSPPVRIPKGYRFPTRRKIPYRPSLEKAGVFHSPDLEPRLSYDLAAEAAAYQLLFRTKVTPWLNFEGIVYYPVWGLEYSYKGDKYRATVDATDGTVLYMEYPLSRGGRAATALQAAAVVAGSAAIGAVVASQLYPWLDP
ncbi:MAG: transcription factor IIB, partial [Pyrobaculum sp.]